MTNTELFFLNLLKSYMNASEPEVPIAKVNCGELIKLSEQHKLTPLVYSALKRNSLSFSDDEMAFIKKKALLSGSAVIMKNEAFFALADAFKAHGLEPITVKGAVLRTVYPEPWVRISSDEDIYIKNEEKDRYESVFDSLGFKKLEQNDGDDTVNAFISKESSLRIEMHTCLFPYYPTVYEKMNSYFKDSFDSRYEVELEGKAVRTLCPDRHLLFLILHSLKHFIYCGFGIRQVMDFALWAKAYSSTLNAEYIISSLRELSALNFFDAILNICDRYLGLSKEELGFADYTPAETSSDEMLCDILSGGIYGNTDPVRLHASTITLAAANGKKGNIFSALFPPYIIMKNRFSYLDKYPILLPFSWACRIVRYLFGKMENKNTAETLEIGSKRLSMLEQYGIVKGGR